MSVEQHEHAGGWTPDRVERMRHMWQVDGLSASQIAASLGEGLTRNGVLGKLHRLKLSRDKPKSASGKRGRAGMPGQAKANSILRRAKTRQRDLKRARQTQRLDPSNGVVADALPELEVLPIPSGAVWLPLDDRSPVPLMALGKHDCKWPLGDPLLPGFGYCGLPADGGAHYCERHHSRSVGRAA